ncbi:RDD family protein [Chloroflexota bacterium]
MAEPSVPSTHLGRYAGFVTRLVAFVIDRAVISVVMLVIALAVRYVLDAFPINQLLGFFEGQWQWAAILGVAVYLAVAILYDIGFWMLAGQTPGKYLMGLRIVRTDADRLKFGNAVRREIGYVLSGILFLGYLWILFDNRRQGFHDKLAGTLVVYSWPEGELKGTFVRDQVQRLRHKRQGTPGQEPF